MFRKLLARAAIRNKAKSGKQAPETGSINGVVLSDTGNIRSNNEDTALFLRHADDAQGSGEQILLMVADGMGGHQAGEVASRLVVDFISREYFNGPPGWKTEQKLLRAFRAANDQIFQVAASSPHYRGMGTTCTALIIEDTTVYYAHVGDSRAYCLKQGRMMQITEDHTYVQQLVKSGAITPEQAVIHPERNILTNAMGTGRELRIDTGKCPFSFEDSDRLLLCSDGLYDYLNDQELAALLLEKRPLQEIAGDMVEEAKKRGGQDNITVVLAERAQKRKSTQKNTEDMELPFIT